MVALEYCCRLGMRRLRLPFPNHVRKGQLPSSHSSQQPSSHSPHPLRHPNDRLHRARKASSTPLGPSSRRLHRRLRLKVRGVHSTAAMMPAVQEVTYHSRPRPLTSFLTKTSIQVSPCPRYSSSATRPRDRLPEPEPLHWAWPNLLWGPYPFDTCVKTAIPDIRRRSYFGATLPVTQHLQDSKRRSENLLNSPPAISPPSHGRGKRQNFQSTASPNTVTHEAASPAANSAVKTAKPCSRRLTGSTGYH
jgi:hypothetical protein